MEAAAAAAVAGPPTTTTATHLHVTIHVQAITSALENATEIRLLLGVLLVV